ncbi:MAG TPA: hypothetical protein VHN14_06490 [Kofleriaceae bacterium]|jgi:hypothetical protein|nr:hypothetical protein [Kofleriaceae bacterium]
MKQGMNRGMVWIVSVAVLFGYQHVAVAEDPAGQEDVLAVQVTTATEPAHETATSSKKTLSKDQIAAAEKAFDVAALPQFTAARGGSLGIPSAGAVSGLQANIDAQLFGDKTNADTFAQLGGLRLDEHVIVDVFAELLDQDLPRFLRETGTVHPEMFTSKLSAASVRIRIHRNGVLLVADFQTPQCMSELALARKNNPDSTLRKRLDSLRTDTGCKIGQINGETSSTFTLGARVLRRSSVEPDGTSSNGAAGELMFQHDGQSVAYYFGLSGIRLTGANDRAGASMVEFPMFSTLRGSAGVEYRGNLLAGELVPRVGAYAVAGHAWWHDPYTFDTINPKIQSSEFELGIYAGGTFNDKFSGIVALRLLRPFGTKQDTAFILSLMPAASALPGGKP